MYVKAKEELGKLFRVGWAFTVHSTQGVLVKPSHAQSWTDAENGMEPCTTIHQALKSRRTCVIWVKSGHELFQESRKQVSVLLEQLLVGYHEINDVSFVTADFADGPAAVAGAAAPFGRSMGRHQNNMFYSFSRYGSWTTML